VTWQQPSAVHCAGELDPTPAQVTGA